MILPLRRYADFSGRSRRIEFWSFILFQWLVYIGLIIMAIGGGLTIGALGGFVGDSTGLALGLTTIIAILMIGLFWLAMLIPNLAVAARRMQDLDMPGIIGIVLVLGGIFLSFPYLIMAVFGFIDGTSGENRFGPDPKQERGVSAIFD